MFISGEGGDGEVANPKTPQEMNLLKISSKCRILTSTCPDSGEGKCDPIQISGTERHFCQGTSQYFSNWCD